MLKHLVLDEKPQLKDAFKELLPLAPKWKTIGTLLGLHPDVLDKIKCDENNSDDCLQKMTSEWLKQASPPPTWANLVTTVLLVDKQQGQGIRQRIATYINI